MPTDELANLLCAQRGSPQAFARLQEELEKPLRHFIFRLVGPHAATDDIVCECLLALHLNLGRLPSPDSLRPFLFRVARNLCYDELRRQGRFDAVSLDGPQGAELQVPDRRTGPDEAACWTQMLVEVQRAMDRLPEMHRQTLILYAEEGLGYAQIAEAMATDLGTVKSRLHYARRSLRRWLPADTREALGLTDF